MDGWDLRLSALHYDRGAAHSLYVTLFITLQTSQKASEILKLFWDRQNSLSSYKTQGDAHLSGNKEEHPLTCTYTFHV